MRDFRDKVAVITGAASGIGFALAKRCATEGMKVVLSDVSDEGLENAHSEIRKRGGDVVTVRTDVSKAEHIEELAQRTLDSFGAVHLLCNNAGVAGGRSIWENPLSEWEWVMGVNLWGVLHGVRTFVPIMQEQDTECHILNTASIAGLLSGSGPGAYKVTKHAVVALTETLFHHLAEIDSKINVSVLCPGFVNTPLMDSSISLSDNTSAEGEAEEWIQRYRQSISEGMPPDDLVEHVFEAIKENRFYILPHPKFKEHIRTRMEDILEERNPTP